MLRLPSVVVIAAFTLTLLPVANKMLPLVVVIAALTFTSRPQQLTRLPFVAVMVLFKFTSRMAFNVNVVVLGDAVQLTALLMLISPLTPFDE